MGLFTTKAAADPTFLEGSIKTGSYTNTQLSDDSRLILNDSSGSPSDKYKLDFSFDGVTPSVEWDDAVGINESQINSIEVTLEAKDTTGTNDYYILI